MRSLRGALSSKTRHTAFDLITQGELKENKNSKNKAQYVEIYSVNS